MTYPGKGKADFYAPGEYNVACAQCGRKFKSSQMRKHWQGYLVCAEHWEPRHPQDFVKSVREEVGVPIAQSPVDTYIRFCTPNGRTAIANFAIAECAKPSVIDPLFDSTVSA